jgi:protein TonB
MSNAGTFRTSRVRIVSFAAVAVLHLTLLLFVVFNVKIGVVSEEPIAGVMKLVDVQEHIPPPPPPERPPPEIPETNTQDAIAETMIETDEIPPSVIYEYTPVVPIPEQIEYLPQYRVSVLPVLPDADIRRAVIYPEIARRSNIEGTVYLELFIDAQGNVRDVTILRENPAGRGFGEAAVNAFRGIRGKPAEANGIPVATRFRYNLNFVLR